MYNVEDQYTGNRDCNNCNTTSLVDISAWKGNEQWNCPKCKSLQEMRLD